MVNSLPSSPSESSLLAFSYENVHQDVDYHNDYHNAQSPSLDQTPLRSSSNISNTGDGFTPLASQLPLKRLEERLEEEYVVELSDKRFRENRMDPFTQTEMAVMILSSILVGVLIVIAVMMTVGELTLYYQV
ncbi:hypothetical protein Clacol_009054 [Clathrus columnatus]|uniref:Uncharacterized protein n=1 Tax=Clathrus columnatus TaxID=1419009 RepID=A0AAV5APG8_9AGAM|nr:hypothetical protein Clacol_009054 [Clathrus columnatus]